MEHTHIPEGTIIPPLRFATVEPYVYRGSYPRPLNFPFLESLELKVILSLTPEPLDEKLKQWADSQGIRQIHIKPEKGQKKSAPLQPAQAKAVLEIALNQENTPIYIHCLNGAGSSNKLMGCRYGRELIPVAEVTSLAICALRKHQRWTHPTIFAEMLRFSEIRTSSEVFLFQGLE
ncbi:hypothetical protein FGG08_006347 [Glutinoglossum americanum]|uniref:Uncharacterized protein n=1 Tax=Glutinoglossum americanum TaxID=1670608 RepID=A0A9P8HW92_9PEZI|nr:hypothetical protein FGG08_006347 [Glutinoglossum americanum]